jgi:ribonucleotide reductase beta subunit family protein with ferritin-like domain
LLTKIQTPTDSYERHYPKLVELANKQLEEQLWFSSEMIVELDRMQLLYELTPEQLHAVKTVLTFFVRYELNVGDMWKRIAEIFPRPEVKLVASVVEMVERAVHAEFYDQPNKQLGLDNDEHYLAFTKDPELKERADWLGGLLNDKEDEILGVIIFSMTETALLFSSFAIFKSFQSNGYNLIPVIARGTNQSAIDEDLHGIISAEIINTYYEELGTSLFEDKKRYNQVVKAVHYAYEHECRIIDIAIPGEKFNGIDKQEYKEFVKYRLNIYLERLGLPHEFQVGVCSITDWFELNTYAYKVIDFFSAGMGMEYESSWDETGFIRGWKED